MPPGLSRLAPAAMRKARACRCQRWAPTACRRRGADGLRRRGAGRLRRRGAGLRRGACGGGACGGGACGGGACGGGACGGGACGGGRLRRGAGHPPFQHLAGGIGRDDDQAVDEAAVQVGPQREQQGVGPEAGAVAALEQGEQHDRAEDREQVRSGQPVDRAEQDAEQGRDHDDAGVDAVAAQEERDEGVGDGEDETDEQDHAGEAAQRLHDGVEHLVEPGRRNEALAGHRVGEAVHERDRVLAQDEVPHAQVDGEVAVRVEQGEIPADRDRERDHDEEDVDERGSPVAGGLRGRFRLCARRDFGGDGRAHRLTAIRLSGSINDSREGARERKAAKSDDAHEPKIRRQCMGRPRLTVHRARVSR